MGSNSLMCCSNILEIRSSIHLPLPVFEAAGMANLTDLFEFMILSRIVFFAFTLVDLIPEVKFFVRMTICTPKSE